MFGFIIYAAFSIVDIIVLLRFIFLLVGANPISQFVSTIYSWSNPFVAPFNGIFRQNSLGPIHGLTTQSIFDWTALVALVVYTVVGAVIGGIVGRTKR